MGNSVVPLSEQSSFVLSGKRKISESHSTKVAIWQLPYSKDYLEYDEDETKWFESKNLFGENELEKAEEGLKMSMTKYKVKTKTIKYNDSTYEVESRYPNENTVIEKHGKSHVFVQIKDKLKQIVAEKLFNYSSKDGRKYVYKNIKQGSNTFTIVEVYSYDTTKNRATDVVNFAYTSFLPRFTRGSTLEKEYYMLNGKEVKAEKNNTGGYKVISKDGKILTFMVE